MFISRAFGTVSVSIFLVFGLCHGCSTAGHTDNGGAIAARLGYEGCTLSTPLTMRQVREKDMSGGYESSRPHPDWDELIQKQAPGELVYLIDCRRAEPSRIFVGTSLYVLVRGDVVIARAPDTFRD
jgi:hypothetical protein